jgi:hypothetical protein
LQSTQPRGRGGDDRQDSDIQREGACMLSPWRGYTLTIAWCLLIYLLTSPPPVFAQNTTIDSFNHAKKLLTGSIRSF